MHWSTSCFSLIQPAAVYWSKTKNLVLASEHALRHNCHPAKRYNVTCRSPASALHNTSIQQYNSQEERTLFTLSTDIIRLCRSFLGSRFGSRCEGGERLLLILSYRSTLRPLGRLQTSPSC
jgi:hypothetical protein